MEILTMSVLDDNVSVGQGQMSLMHYRCHCFHVCQERDGTKQTLPVFNKFYCKIKRKFIEIWIKFMDMHAFGIWNEQLTYAIKSIELWNSCELTLGFTCNLCVNFKGGWVGFFFCHFITCLPKHFKIYGKRLQIIP